MPGMWKDPSVELPELEWEVEIERPIPSYEKYVRGEVIRYHESSPGVVDFFSLAGKIWISVNPNHEWFRRWRYTMADLASEEWVNVTDRLPDEGRRIQVHDIRTAGFGYATTGTVVPDHLQNTPTSRVFHPDDYPHIHEGWILHTGEYAASSMAYQWRYIDEEDE